MRKVLAKVLVFCSALTLTACDFLAFLKPQDEPTNNNNQGGGGDDNPPPVVEPSITSVSVAASKEYCIGDVYNANDIIVTASYDNGTTREFDSSTIKATEITDPNGQKHNKSSAFDRAGDYHVEYKVRLDNKSYYPNLDFSIETGFNTTGFTLQSFELSKDLVLRSGDVLNDKLDNLELLLHWNNGNEYYTYSKVESTGFTFSLKKQGDGLTEYIDEELEALSTYDLTISYGTLTYSYELFVPGNYYRLSIEDNNIIYTDIDDSTSPSKGDVKMLIIPITLSGNYTDTWTNSRLSEIDGYYFGMDEDKISLKKYYETASFGQMNVSGLVTDPYVETNPNLTSDNIQNSGSYSKLFTLIANAVDFIKTEYPEIDLDDYDLNDDGAIDNIHLITNFNTDSYRTGTGENPWSTPLWPHKSGTGNTGTKASPVANVYSISAINHVQDGITAIHEQGHIFGLDDYYDYAQTDVDYVGCADMQSYNMFDWNSFSKFAVGWIEPYVITGPTDITIQAASINGDCLVIPANPETFSNSAFDEYFLIELFSPYGNNAMNYPVRGVYQGSVWDYYSNNYANLGDYGVRLYHVNAQLYKYTYTDGFVPVDGKIGNNRVWQVTDNNIYDYPNRYFDDFADYKLLSVIQRGGVDTFGSTASGARHYLSSTDLFRQGDVFTFDAYKQFLTKTNAVPSTMNNGETFPYKITFTEMSATEVTVKVELA